MAVIRPFECVRPEESVADRVAALPYDVYDSKEARVEVEREPLSFLKIDRAETQFDESVDMYSEQVYKKAHDMLMEAIDDGTFITDKDKAYYVYELTMDGRTQTGIVACASIDDYLNNVIKKHENTRADKELDRINHVDTCSERSYNFKYKSVSDFYGLLAEFLAGGGTLNDAEDYLKTVSCLDDYNSIRVVEEFRKKILN